MKNNKDKNINSNNIDIKYQKIETEDFYIEAPSWVNIDLLDDSDICCNQCKDSIVHKHTPKYESTEFDLNDFNLFKNSYDETNIIADNFNNSIEAVYRDDTKEEFLSKPTKKYTETICETKNNKNNTTNKKKTSLLACLALIIGIPVAVYIVEEAMYYSSEYTFDDKNESYTFNKIPEQVYNLSTVSNSALDNVTTNYIFKKCLGDNQIVSIESINDSFVLTLSNSRIDTKFQLSLNSTEQIAFIEDIIQLSNGDFVINATLEKNEIYISTILHYSNNGLLKKRKDFNDSTCLKNLYAQPDSQNYFLTSLSDGTATVYKFTGNSNPVFEFKVDKEHINSISAFPVKKDLYLFYSYYDENYDLVCDAVILNAFGNVINRNDSFLKNALLDNGIYIEDSGFLFEESVTYSSDVLENKVIKIDFNLDIEEITVEEFDFYSNKLFKMDNGYMSVRETVFTPLENESEIFPILTFVKFDDNGKEEWTRHANYYSSGQSPVIGCTFTPNHIYIKDNKITIEASGINSRDELEDVNFTVDALGNINPIE